MLIFLGWLDQNNFSQPWSKNCVQSTETGISSFPHFSIVEYCEGTIFFFFIAITATVDNNILSFHIKVTKLFLKSRHLWEIVGTT